VLAQYSVRVPPPPGRLLVVPSAHTIDIVYCRLHLNYGGGDIERALQYLLAQGRWKHWPSTSSSAPKWQPPFKFEMTDIQHRTIVREFKEKLCHLDTVRRDDKFPCPLRELPLRTDTSLQSDEWEQTFEFALRTKGQPTAVYQMDAPRELLFVPPLVWRLLRPTQRERERERERQACAYSQVQCGHSVYTIPSFLHFSREST